MKEKWMIPNDLLLKKEDAVRRVAAAVNPSGSFDIDDSDYGAAYRRVLLFAQAPDEISRVLGLGSLSRQQIFYNSYFWLSRFSYLYSKQHGFDAGLQQQAMRILETAQFELDWSVINELDRFAIS